MFRPKTVQKATECVVFWKLCWPWQ